MLLKCCQVSFLPPTELFCAPYDVDAPHLESTALMRGYTLQSFVLCFFLVS